MTIICLSLGVQSLKLIFLFINGEMRMQEACVSGGVENKLTKGQKLNCVEFCALVAEYLGQLWSSSGDSVNAVTSLSFPHPWDGEGRRFTGLPA